MKLKLISIFLVLASLFVAYATTTYNKGISCYKTERPLTATERRHKVLKKILALKIRETKNQNEYGGQYKTAVVPKRIDEADIIRLINSASILDLEKGPIVYINNEIEINNLDNEILQNDFTIIRYSTTQREMEIIPSHDIEEASDKEVKEFFGGENKKQFELSWLEKLRGYGNVLYKIKTFDFIDLACCDNLGSKYGKDSSWYIHKNIELIQWKNMNVKKHLVASNCGELLLRNYDGTVIYLF